MAEGEEAMSQEDWKEKCLVLEALLMKFRVQIIKIRELTGDKVGLQSACSAPWDQAQLHQSITGQGAAQLDGPCTLCAHPSSTLLWRLLLQLQWMEEKLQPPDGQTGAGGSEVRLLGRCQELQALLQEKEETVVLLEQQLEEQFEVENAALRESNRQQEAQIQELQKQVLALEQKRGLSVGAAVGALARPGEAQRLSSLTFGCFQVRGKSPQVLTGPEPSQRTLSAQPLTEAAEWGGGDGARSDNNANAATTDTTAFSEMDSRRPLEETAQKAPGGDSGTAPDGGSGGPRPGVTAAGALQCSRPGSEYYLTASDDSSSLFDDDMQRVEHLPHFSLHGSADGEPGAADRLEDATSEELNQRFQSHRLDSSTSSLTADPPHGLGAAATPALTPKRPNPPRDPRDTPASPKQPRLRTPVQGFGVMSVAQAKKHLSQPPVYSESTHGRTRNALSMLRPLRPQETDLDGDQEQRGREVVMETGPQEVPKSPSPPATQTLNESGGEETGASPEPPSSAPGSKPPTPPLHRFPSWVGRPHWFTS
ncbi:hypothetical protein CRUP_035516 [Coryphaenoides rupestris]|nr:hypothetical protein CRUP_035516 [Coryphaenoides rupestris]